ncbi:MAG: DUF1837 domain-containing protein [Candidatus Omnitrophota bacterium]
MPKSEIKTPFGSETVITQHISEADLKTYFVGFDLGEYRWDPLIGKLLNALVDFAFGYHDGILTNTYNREKLKEAAKAIYKIDPYDSTNHEHKKYRDEDDFFEKKYGRRGEFGELILHLLLRDFHNTICLLSKVFFKDADGITVHGFDAVHIHAPSKSLWLGESKLHASGSSGVKELTQDIMKHFERDYLLREFALISKKRNFYADSSVIPDKDRWFDLIDVDNTLENILESVTIPLLCTYTSEVFNKHNSEKTAEFVCEYENEMRALKKYFDDHRSSPIKTDLRIILLLFPVPNKNVLLKKLHEKLSYIQKI